MLVLEIRVPGRTHRLLISCHAETARLHFTATGYQNPPTPPPFCQFLRAHLQGARIDLVEQIQGDRIVRLSLTAKEGAGWLVAELTGKRSNLLVLDGTGRIRRDLNGVKDLVGQLYVPPAHQQRERDKPPDHARFSQGIQNRHFLCRLPSTPITTAQKPLRSSRPCVHVRAGYSGNPSRSSAVASRPGMKTSQRQKSTRPTLVMANSSRRTSEPSAKARPT